MTKIIYKNMLWNTYQDIFEDQEHQLSEFKKEIKYLEKYNTELFLKIRELELVLDKSKDKTIVLRKKVDNSMNYISAKWCKG